jgi:hypothetical protein
MSKVLFFFRASPGRKAALADGVRAELQQFWDRQEGCTSATLMVAAEDDPFRRATPPCVAKDVVVEIRSPHPSATVPLLHSWTGVATRLGSHLDPQESTALLGYDRVFLPCDPQPVHFHYLMRRREDLTDADYYEHYVNFHSQYGLTTPGAPGYRQTYVDADASRTLGKLTGLVGPIATSVSELELPSIRGLLEGTRTVDSGATADELRFVDRPRSIMFCSDVVLRLGS